MRGIEDGGWFERLLWRLLGFARRAREAREAAVCARAWAERRIRELESELATAQKILGYGLPPPLDQMTKYIERLERENDGMRAEMRRLGRAP